MQCPVCNGDMWDASKSKFPRKPGSPDFRCKDKDCKYQLNRETGQYEPGEYTTGVWLPKATKVAVKAVVAPKTAIPQPVTDHAKKEMLISYAKDIVVAEIAKGEVKEPFKRVADGFKILMMAYTHPFGKTEKKLPVIDVEQEQPPLMEEEHASEDEEMPF